MAYYIFPREAPYARAILGWDGTDFRVPVVDVAGHLQIDVLTSALPTGSATAANQATMITALQLIDNLINALQSVNTDALQVRGENQLFSIKDVYQERVVNLNTGAGNNNLAFTLVPAGEIWIVTNGAGLNLTSAISAIDFFTRVGGTDYRATRLLSPAIGQALNWAGHLYLAEGARVKFTFLGCNAGDTISAFVHGYKMSKE